MDWRQATQRLSCILLLTASAFPLAAISPPPPAKTCDAVMKWAQDNRADLPADYRGLLSYPLDQRRAIYTHLSAAEKAAFWGDKIAVYVEEHPQLTAGQRQALAEARAFVTPELYALAQDRAARAERISDFLARLTLSLGEPTVRDLFYGLGPAGQDSGRSLVPLCDCFVPRDCPSSATCIDLASCQPTIEGCGAIGTLECQGLCTFP